MVKLGQTFAKLAFFNIFLKFVTSNPVSAKVCTNNRTSGDQKEKKGELKNKKKKIAITNKRREQSSKQIASN